MQKTFILKRIYIRRLCDDTEMSHVPASLVARLVDNMSYQYQNLQRLGKNAIKVVALPQKNEF